MSEESAAEKLKEGPGNRPIAATTLEWLGVRGRFADRDRAARALGADAHGILASGGWLCAGAIQALFQAGQIDAGWARALGQRLIAPDLIGLSLYRLGMATPEKAFRRIGAVLPRLAREDAWMVDAVGDRNVSLRYVPVDSSAPSEEQVPVAGASRIAEVLCSLRVGMIESVPGLYGLLPAEVECRDCISTGAAACSYRVRWHGLGHASTRMGASIGAGLTTGIVVAGFAMSGSPLVGVSHFFAGGLGASLGLGAILASPILCGVLVGYVMDLRAQLEAVAGARRGHLALYDQVDDVLASRLDALARAEQALEGVTPSGPVRRERSVDPGEDSLSPSQCREMLRAAQEIHSVAGELECWFDKEFGVEAAEEGIRISDERGRVREIREWAARITREAGSASADSHSLVDLGRLVHHAFAAVRPGVPNNTVLNIEVDPALEPIECEPIQIEHVIVQLVRNAVEASAGLSDAPRVDVRLHAVDGGVEIVVEDRGVGIDSTEVDEVFDPFFGDPSAASSGSLGLPVCLRIVEGHGGALRIESQDRVGTRVTVFLPNEKRAES